MKAGRAGLLTSAPGHLGRGDSLWGRWPVHGRPVSSIPGVYSLYPLPSCDRQHCPSSLPVPPAGSASHCRGVHGNRFIPGDEGESLAQWNLPFPGPREQLGFLPVKRGSENVGFWPFRQDRRAQPVALAMRELQRPNPHRTCSPAHPQSQPLGRCPWGSGGWWQG